MRITESRLRQIIKSVIEENYASEGDLRDDLKELFRYLDLYNHIPMGMEISAATESNLAYVWSRMQPNYQDDLYKKLELERPDLMNILKRVMNSSDKVKTRTHRSR